jgi:ATP-binding cassette, subfamily B, bacterial
MMLRPRLLHRRKQSQPSTWSRLRPLIGERPRLIVALGGTSILSGFTEACILAVVAQVAVSFVKGHEHVTVKIGPAAVHATVGGMLTIALSLAVVRLALQLPISVLPARIAADVQAGMRKRLFGAFTDASWAMQSRDREGHLQEMMTSQVMQATQGALQMAILVTALFAFSMLILSAFALNVVAAVVVLGAAVVLFAALRPLNALGHRRARELSQAQMSYAGGVGEAVRVIEETHVFGVAGALRERVGRLVGTAQGLFFRTQMLARLVPNLYQSLILLVIVGGLIALHASGAGHFASLGAVVLMLLRAGTYGQQMQASYQIVRQALPFVERLQDAEMRYTASSPVEGRRPLPRVRTLRFESVSYAYRTGNPVLSDITFQVVGGEAIGVVGPSGAGKSTLVQILLRLRDPDEGRYLVNDLPVEEIMQGDWQRQVAYVPQEPRLIHASVADNIRYFRDLDDEAVKRAAQLARIHDDIIGWSKGYETIVGPRADAVSGGQQQRICLARALAAQPEVLVLDEPTSALDPRSEVLIQESLTALKDSVTLFIVAHRMSTLDICDRVMVIVDGRLEAFDTIGFLQRESAYYRSASALAAGVVAEVAI